MKAKILLCTIMTVLSLAPCVFAQRAGQDFNSLARFQNGLRQEGFDVTLGLAGALNLPEEYCAGTADTALYANNEPYVQVQVPESAQKPRQLSAFFQLRPDEAVVLIGLTPPPARYFSYGPYLWSRVYPDGITRVPFATVGDAVNNATVNTIGSTPFNAPVVLIFTPDRTTEARVRVALRRAGYPAAIINTVVFPASILNLGHGVTADPLRIVLRNAIWEEPDAGKRYLTDIGKNLHVFRVTPRTLATADSFPAPRLRIRGTGRTEMDLANKLGELRQGIIAANPGSQATDIVTMPMCYEGYDLIQRGIELCGDSRDAFYVGAGLPEFDQINQITLADGEFLMLYGVNHVASGKATYMNTNIYASETAKLTLGAIDDRKFTGKETATPYLPPGDPDANLMYAYKISRYCGGESNCKQLAVPDGCTRVTLDSSTLLGIFTRIYLEPATKIGPAMSEMLYDRVTKFSPWSE
jgi:hypothetical protein